MLTVYPQLEPSPGHASSKGLDARYMYQLRAWHFKKVSLEELKSVAPGKASPAEPNILLFVDVITCTFESSHSIANRWFVFHLVVT